MYVPKKWGKNGKSAIQGIRAVFTRYSIKPTELQLFFTFF